jgi:cytochrome c
MKAINIKAYTTDNTQIDAIKAFMKALKIKFEVSKESPYRQEFVDKIEKGEEDFSNGLGEKITVDELNNLWK